MKAHEAGWRNAKHRQQWQNTLSTYAYRSSASSLSMRSTTGLVMQILQLIWIEKNETPAASGADRKNSGLGKVNGTAAAITRLAGAVTSTTSRG